MEMVLGFGNTRTEPVPAIVAEQILAEVREVMVYVLIPTEL